jgi:glycosyltransferase involved in cell wall biosynthesis
MLSVVLATCNGERYIAAQVDSICGQLEAEDEIIVCDDASTDRTVAILVQRSDPRIKITVNSARLGYVKNFEQAIAQARGEYILFSDQDDVWLPGKSARMQSALRTKTCVASDAIVVDHDLHELYPSYFQFRRASKFSLTAVFLRPCFIGATMALRSDYLRTLLPFPADVPHDFWISLNAIWDCQMAVIPEPLILYRRHAATASISATTLKRRRWIILSERIKMARHLSLFRLKRAIIGRSTPARKSS